MEKQVFFKDLGHNKPYKEVWDYQETLLQQNLTAKASARDAAALTDSPINSSPTNDQPPTVNLSSVNRHLSPVNSSSFATNDYPPTINPSSPTNDQPPTLNPSSSVNRHLSPVNPPSPINDQPPTLNPSSSVNRHLSTVNSSSLINDQPPTINAFSVNRHLSPVNASSPINYLLFVEHSPVYTLGKSGNMNHVLIGADERQQKGIEFFKINRGGDITFHGPGQLVGYPIFDLEQFKTDLGWYLRSLEEVIILTMAAYGLKGERSKGETGVWLDPAIKGKERKICAMGIRCSRWITMHGFAFNVNTNLDYFDYIVPCGIQHKEVTSLQKELGHEVPFDEVIQKVRRNFEIVFGVTIVSGFGF